MEYEDRTKLIDFETLQNLSNSVRNKILDKKIGTNRGKIQLFITRETRDALIIIKQQNSLASMNSAIDLLIATVAMYQYSDNSYVDDMLKSGKDELRRFKNGRKEVPVIINGREYKSANYAAKMLSMNTTTLTKRIQTLTLAFREWNFKGENILEKYKLSKWNNGILELNENNTKGWA